MSFSGGDGSLESPYLISSAEDLQAIAGEYLGNHFLQTNDIDLASIAEWNGIGDYNEPFFGVYDGQNFNIWNMNSVDVDNDRRGGLFSHVWGVDENNYASVKNVKVVDAYCTTPNSNYYNHAVFVSDAYFASFENCHVIRGRVLHSASYGSAGFCGGDWQCEYTDCSADVVIESEEPDWSFADCGGFISTSGYSVITNCHCKFKMFNAQPKSGAGGGGFIGLLWPPFTITKCSANGSIFADSDYSDCGGFIGRLEMYDPPVEGAVQLIQNCYCKTDISQTNLKANMYASYKIDLDELWAFWNGKWGSVDENGTFNYRRVTFKYVGSGSTLPLTSVSIKGHIFYRTSNTTFYIFLSSWTTMPINTIRSYYGAFSIVLKDSSTTDPVSAEQGWLYFNTTDGDIKVFVNGAWEFVGDFAHTPLGYIFLGQFSENPTDPTTPRLNDLYYNNIYHQYLYWTGSTWDISNTTVRVVPFVWKGALAADPADPENLWVYYNTADTKTYIYDAGVWTRCGDTYYGPIVNGDLYIRWRNYTLETEYDDVYEDSFGDIANFIGYLTSSEEYLVDILQCYCAGHTNMHGLDDTFINFYDTDFSITTVNIEQCFCLHGNDLSNIANPLSRAEFAEVSHFADAGWDFVVTWFMDTEYPILQTQKYGFPPVDNVILEKLNLIKLIKTNLSVAIEAKHVTVGDSLFEEYPTLIGNIGIE